MSKPPITTKSSVGAKKKAPLLARGMACMTSAKREKTEVKMTMQEVVAS